MRSKGHEGVGVGEERPATAKGGRKRRFARGTSEERALPKDQWDELLDLRAAVDPIFVVDGERIVAVNERAEALVGCSREELLDIPFAQVVSCARDAEPLLAAPAGVRFVGPRAAATIHHRNGSTIPIDLVVWAGRHHSFVVMARESAPRGVLREEEMFEIVHDLKNPLSTIAIDAQIIGHHLDPEGALSQVARIERNVAYMDRLVHELLDLCSIDSGSLTLERRPVELRSLLEHILDRVVSEERRRLVFLDAYENVVVACDEFRIERVVANLLENAVKYSPTGSDIIVQLRTRYPLTCVSIIDCGPGMSPRDCERVFDKFKRATTGPSGSGLGLYVSRKIIEAHGGRLDVESVPGVGSRFFFELPVSRRGGGATER